MSTFVTTLKPLCRCKKEMKLLQVKKNGPNQGKYFYTCDQKGCNSFHWYPPVFDNEEYKNGTCYRCGRWGCDATDCDETHNWFGVPIPDDPDSDWNETTSILNPEAENNK